MSELNFSLNKIIENKYIDNVFILSSNNDLKYINLNNEKIKLVEIEGRPTFKTTIDIINNYTSDNDINILINSDCYIVESTTELIHNIKDNEVWCLNKYEVIDKDFNLMFNGYEGSQDCWVFRGFILILMRF
jgi:hypothetical protein